MTAWVSPKLALGDVAILKKNIEDASKAISTVETSDSADNRV